MNWTLFYTTFELQLYFRMNFLCSKLSVDDITNTNADLWSCNFTTFCAVFLLPFRSSPPSFWPTHETSLSSVTKSYFSRKDSWLSKFRTSPENIHATRTNYIYLEFVGFEVDFLLSNYTRANCMYRVFQKSVYTLNLTMQLSMMPTIRRWGILFPARSSTTTLLPWCTIVPEINSTRY